ncbi:52 kDa repressor of the inhibitor of the protein kinase-like, partial [Sipha flava]|uniref:52 kDa repressor of the inhibitor of the protein kinase-like n=1 Tax=Sipha flava TaxID=143950 RepID=A0A8B8FE85_9HEMI
NRANPDPNLSVEEYHKVSVFIPYLDFFIQLGEKFSIHSEIYKGFQNLFSYTLTSNEEVSFRKLLEFYSSSLDVNNSIAELKLLKITLERINNIPKTAIEALHVCNANIYPNVHFILKIICTLPVSTSTPERMGSSLKRIKTYLRNSMSEKRLNGLAMLAIHNDITFSNEEVIDELAKKPRNLDIIL